MGVVSFLFLFCFLSLKGKVIENMSADVARLIKQSVIIGLYEVEFNQTGPHEPSLLEHLLRSRCLNGFCYYIIYISNVACSFFNLSCWIGEAYIYKHVQANMEQSHLKACNFCYFIDFRKNRTMCYDKNS